MKDPGNEVDLKVQIYEVSYIQLYSSPSTDITASSVQLAQLAQLIVHCTGIATIDKY